MLLNNNNQDATVYTQLGLEGRICVINGVTMTVYQVIGNGSNDGTSYISYCTGLTKPTDATAGFAKDCFFIKTDAASSTEGLYKNLGTVTSCLFVLDDNSVPGDLTVPHNYIIVGNSSNVGVAVAQSGDVTFSDTGVSAIGANKVKKAMISTETVSVTVTAGNPSGTATVTSGSIVLGAPIPAGNQDKFIDNVTVVGTTLTITLAANATADNVFSVVLLKA